MKYSGLFLIFFFAQATGYSQYYFYSGNHPEPELRWELGVAAGAANCLTDIGGKNGPGRKLLHDINWSQTRAAVSIDAGATWHSVVGIRASCSAAFLSGADAVLGQFSGSDAHDRYQRNLSFRTGIVEAALSLQGSPLSLLFPASERHDLTPFVQAGVALLYYNPQAWYNDAWVNLRNLHTEGQGFPEYPGRRPYGKFTWSIPAGCGIQYDASGACIARLLLCYRFTGTDYLDDVSTKYIDPGLFSLHLPDKQAETAAALADRTAEIMPGGRHRTGEIRGTHETVMPGSPRSCPSTGSPEG